MLHSFEKCHLRGMGLFDLQSFSALHVKQIGVSKVGCFKPLPLLCCQSKFKTSNARDAAEDTAR